MKMAENKSILAFSPHKNDQQSNDGTAENITFSRKRLVVEMMPYFSNLVKVSTLIREVRFCSIWTKL